MRVPDDCASAIETNPGSNIRLGATSVGSLRLVRLVPHFPGIAPQDPLELVSRQPAPEPPSAVLFRALDEQLVAGHGERLQTTIPHERG